jgi:hypothetical protein
LLINCRKAMVDLIFVSMMKNFRVIVQYWNNFENIQSREFAPKFWDLIFEILSSEYLDIFPSRVVRGFLEFLLELSKMFSTEFRHWQEKLFDLCLEILMKFPPSDADSEEEMSEVSVEISIECSFTIQALLFDEKFQAPTIFVPKIAEIVRNFEENLFENWNYSTLLNNAKNIKSLSESSLKTLRVYAALWALGAMDAVSYPGKKVIIHRVSDF